MSVKILVGDALEMLRTLPSESVHTCCTSPPYFGLRDYGTAAWDGGDPDCDHSGVRRGHGDEKQSTSAGTSRDPVSRDCRRCGARRIDRQIGLEASPAEYVETLVAVFREVRRVLRRDGTLWLNLGDSYHNYRVHKDGGQPPQGFHRDRHGQPETGGRNRGTRINGVKEKDLLGIPWMVAFALRADGWWLRQDIIWSKPNPMPESVTDRCTKAHEYLFLLSNSARYYFDQDAISEDATARRQQRLTAPTEHPKAKLYGGLNFVDGGISDTRNKRSVWTVTTQPYTEAHFATFPPALVEPCILAGCPKGATVLDPFGGAGTTGLVADRLDRDAILIELNPAYAEMARRRIADDAGMFAEVA